MTPSRRQLAAVEGTARRLGDSHKPQRVLQVPDKDMPKATAAMKRAGPSFRPQEGLRQDRCGSKVSDDHGGSGQRVQTAY